VTFLIEECMAREQAGEPVAERLQEIAATLREAYAYVNRVANLHSDEEEDDAGYYELDAVIAGHLELARLLLPRGSSLNYLPADERLSFYASRRAVEEILLHVVGNCGEALPHRGGAVTISGRPDDRQADRVRIEIRDNGPGFAAEALERLFVSFETTKKESLHAGIGLLRCRNLARSFGGDLTAENHSDGGAVVTLTLPRDNSASFP
jgi:C4-dicarboxylate-specific signal transduction histidine kinase